MSTSASFWDKAARKYAASQISDMDGYNYTLERTRSYLDKSQRALEIGCGTGSTALLLADSVGHITGTDISNEMIEIAREKLWEESADNVRFEVSEAVHAGETDPFDVVLAHNLLHLVPNIDDTLDHVAAMTKKGGLFISKTPVKPSKFQLKFTAISKIIPLMQLFGKAPFVRFNTGAEFDRMFEARGFRIVETWDQPGTLTAHYVVARKL